MSKASERISNIDKYSYEDILFEMIRYASYWLDEHDPDENIREISLAYLERISHILPNALKENLEKRLSNYMGL